MRRFLFILFLLLIPTLALPSDRIPTSYRIRKILWFPLDLPSYILRGTTWPLTRVGRFLEFNHVIPKTLNFLTNEAGTFIVYPLIQVGGGSSFGGGAGLRHSDWWGKDIHLGLQAMIFADLDRHASFSLGHPTLFLVGDSPVGGHLSFRYRQESNIGFYGIGNQTIVTNRTAYALRELEGEGELHFQPHPSFSILPHLSVRQTRGEGTSGQKYPSIETIFPPATLAGLGETMTYLDMGLRLVHDTRDLPSFPTRGGVRGFSFHRFQGMGDNSHYFQYSLELAHFFRLWSPRHVLALGNRWTHQQESGGTIPFYQLNSLGLENMLRGFDRFRFHDRSSVLFNVEYRYPIWHSMDGTLFFDTGRTFGSLQEISLRNLKYSGGGGIRIRAYHHLLFRMQAAYGGEGVNLIFTAGADL